VRFGYDLSYRVRAPEAASATTQRTENPIRRLFVFLDPRAQTGKVSCFLELVAVAIVLPLSVVLPVEARRRPLLDDSEARCSAIASRLVGVSSSAIRRLAAPP